MSTAAATEEENKVDPQAPVIPEFDLTPEREAEVEQAVIAANAGKAKEELTEEITKAKETEKAKLIEANKPILAKAAELAKDEANKGKSEDELFEMAAEALEKAAEENPAEPTLGDDFFGGAFGNKKGADTKPNDGVTPPAPSAFVVPDDVKPLWDEFQAAKQDPIFSAFLEAKKNGVEDFVDMISKSGLTVNPDAIPHQELKRYQLNQLRQSDPSITEEDIAEGMEVFNAKSKLDQAAEVAPIRAQLKQHRDEALKMFQSNVSKKATVSKEVLTKSIQKAESELNGLVQSKESFYGVAVTQTVANNILNKVRQQGFSFALPDGSPDVDRTLRNAFLESHVQDMVQAAFDRGVKHQSRKEANKRSKSLTGLKVRGALPKPSTPDRKAALDAAWEAKSGKKTAKA